MSENEHLEYCREEVYGNEAERFISANEALRIIVGACRDHNVFIRSGCSSDLFGPALEAEIGKRVVVGSDSYAFQIYVDYEWGRTERVPSYLYSIGQNFPHTVYEVCISFPSDTNVQPKTDARGDWLDRDVTIRINQHSGNQQYYTLADNVKFTSAVQRSIERIHYLLGTINDRFGGRKVSALWRTQRTKDKMRAKEREAMFEKLRETYITNFTKCLREGKSVSIAVPADHAIVLSQKFDHPNPDVVYIQRSKHKNDKIDRKYIAKFDGSHLNITRVKI